MNETTWVEFLDRAHALATKERFEEAIEVTLECEKIYSGNRDALSWAAFIRFQNLLTLGRLREAARLALVLLDLDTNLAAKIHVMSVALDIERRAEQNDECFELIKAFDTCIERWLKGAKNNDDFSIRAGSLVISQIEQFSAIVPQLLSQTSLSDDHEVLNTLEYKQLKKELPVMFNVIPPVISNFVSDKQARSVLSLKRGKNVGLLRIGAVVCGFNSEGTMLSINYSSCPDFFRVALEDAARTASVIEVPGLSVSMLDEYAVTLNFCHWIADYLPRLLFAEAEFSQINNIIGPVELTPGFQEESLRPSLFKSSYLSLKPNVLYRFENLVYADNFDRNLCHPAFYGHPEVLRLIRQRLGNAKAGGPALKLYVPRRHSRRVKNETELMSVLAVHGYQMIDTDHSSLSQQVDLFQRATHVIGPHGAALTNIIFCQPKTRILELFPVFGGSGSFYVLAAAGNLEYSCYIDLAGAARPVESLAPHNNAADMNVDLNFVRSWLDRSDR